MKQAYIAILLLTTCAAQADDVVKRLYKDFAWEAFLDNDKTGEYLYYQKPRILSRFFTGGLAGLIHNDALCAAKHGMCRLDFNMIFPSQDPNVTDLTIKREGRSTHVHYKSSGQDVDMEFRLKRTKNGKRIDDILYKDMSDLTLRQVMDKQALNGEAEYH